MFQTNRWFPVLLILLLVCVAFYPLAMLRAQTQNTILSIALPEYLANNIPVEALSAFEADHPGVKVNLVKLGNDMYFAPAAVDADQYFKGVEAYASKADVLYVSNYNLATEGTRAGYFLDLSPLVHSDAALNSNDFQPGTLEAFQWDGGLWALPVSLDVILMTYDAAAFDKAGIPYPDGKWTVDDLADVARKLTEKDTDGKVTLPGILAYNEGPLFRSMAGESFFDSAAALSAPQFDKPVLIHLLEVWSKLQADGVTGANFQGDYDAVPMRIDQSFALAKNMGGGTNPRQGALLPGGKAGLSVDGFAVSGGAQHPELAYALVKFITGEPKIATHFFGLMPARKNISVGNPSDDPSIFRPTFSPENQAVIDSALANVLPPAEYRFTEYLNLALSDMSEKQIDAKTALQAAQAKANDALKQASSKKAVAVVAVATPVPTPILGQGEISIKFNLMAYISPLPNRDKWDAVIKDFTSTDPQVRQVVLDTGFGSNGPSDLVDKYDCFAIPYNLLTVSGGIEPQLLALDPLINADASFDKNDIIGNALAQLQEDNKTLGFPLYIQPQVLRYNTEAFAKAGIPAPGSNWQIDAFNDALKALKVGAKDPAPFVPLEFGGTYLQLLMAAYGGLPLDHRTKPVTVNFTDPATVDSIRQVLDLARNGYIDYRKLTVTGGGMGGGPLSVPIYTASLNMINYYAAMNPGDNKDPYKPVAYPKGSRYTPVAYMVGAAYISSKAANPEACYRWISTLARHPELFWSMPALRSQLDSPGVTAQGADIAAFYKEFDRALQDPAAVSVSGDLGSIGDYVLSYFLYRVFDRYVLDNADLDADLKQAEMFARGYQECIAIIPPNTATTPKAMMDYYKQFTDCAIKIDPTLKPILAPDQ